MHHRSYLALEDGSLFRGFSLGAAGIRCGEAVFNTAMSGYQEILSDPSYSGQVLCFTFPHIGNTGINPEDHESDRPLIAGAVMRHASPRVSSWRSRQSLPDWLKQHDLPCLTGVDTRALTRRLREQGSLKACLVCGEDLPPEEAFERARAWSGLAGQGLARNAGRPLALQWREPTPWPPQAKGEGGGPHIVVLDFGAKANICRLLVDAGCRVTTVPGGTDAATLLALKADGFLLSNGPGDPAALPEIVDTIRELFAARRPLFGICLGHQLLALACGAGTWKMPFGHHGANHPVQELAGGRVWITSQNHGFAVREDLPDELVVTHRSLFDNSIQGIRHRDLPVFGFQGHPEAGPGPHDAKGLFAGFIRMCETNRKENR